MMKSRSPRLKKENYPIQNIALQLLTNNYGDEL